MTVSLRFYSDAALETELSTLTVEQDTGNVLDPTQTHLYLGSTATSKIFRAASDPGVDQITLSVIDSAAGTGQPASAVKLALTQVGLATAVAGAALDLGTEILSGAANAVSVWVEIDDQTEAVGNYTELSLRHNTIRESAV